MKPTVEDMDALLRFLPIFQQEGYSPVVDWRAGTGKEVADPESEEGTVVVHQLGYPEYRDEVREFFDILADSPIVDRSYDPCTAGEMIDESGFIERANLDQVRQMLTFCFRGERFCDGHWEAMIEEGVLQRLLMRLAELRDAEG